SKPRRVHSFGGVTDRTDIRYASIFLGINLWISGWKGRGDGVRSWGKCWGRSDDGDDGGRRSLGTVASKDSREHFEPDLRGMVQESRSAGVRRRDARARGSEPVLR